MTNSYHLLVSLLADGLVAHVQVRNLVPDVRQSLGFFQVVEKFEWKKLILWTGVVHADNEMIRSIYN